MKKVLFFFICLFPGILLSGQNERWDKLNAWLEQEECLKTSEVGISVYDLTAGRPVFVYQDKKLYRPASNQKLITAITALEKLGKDHPFYTHIYYSGTIREKELDGDIYIVGGFDPEFDEEGMDYLVSLIDNAGIKKINGNLYGDVSMTDSLYWGAGWSWDDAPYAFQPALSPLMFSKGTVKVTAIPGQKDSVAVIRVTPVSSYYAVENKTVSRCPDAGKFSVTRNWLENGNRITVSGNVETTRFKEISVHASADFFMHVYTERLQKRGISVTAGGYAWKEYKPAGDSTIVFLGKYAHFLPDVLKPALKKSDNLSAEAVFYQLASLLSGKKRVSGKDGTAAIERFIGELGFRADDYSIADGSGASLYNYISPELLIAFLRHAHSRPEIFRILYESLPIAGVDGTLANRMKKGRAYRNVRAKTGSVTGVSSLSGYLKTSEGHLLAFAILNQNILKLNKARAFQDRFCELLCR